MMLVAYQVIPIQYFSVNYIRIITLTCMRDNYSLPVFVMMIKGYSHDIS